MRVFGSWEPVDKTLGAIGLEVPAYFVELLSGVTHDFAGLGNVVEVFSEFK